ncbi:hypothetical protein ABPG75_011673 [Micractinium tetrahymenae]
MAPPQACPLPRQQEGWQSTVPALAPPSPALGSAPGPAAFGCPYATSLHRKVVGLVEARLRQGGRLRRYALAEVAAHNSKDDGWVAVDGKVFDITHHVLTHPGWTSGCATSQLLAILRTLGTDCTEEVLMVHSAKALAQFAPYLIGVLAEDGGAESAACSGGDEAEHAPIATE